MEVQRRRGDRHEDEIGAGHRRLGRWADVGRQVDQDIVVLFGQLAHLPEPALGVPGGFQGQDVVAQAVFAGLRQPGRGARLMIGVHQRYRMARAVGKRPTEINRDGGLAGAALQVTDGDDLAGHSTLLFLSAPTVSIWVVTMPNRVRVGPWRLAISCG
jgi:hypothetical protein